jgi:nitrite reductase/ring-hydroxylating ferredoxin subunit
VSDVADAELSRRWFPICSREDLAPRHIVETELLGRELAVWRSSDGGVNVWSNRCPHRGMRLTVGVNFGRELRCAYHGYRFADGSGACTAVPAQPDKTPPRSLRVQIYPVLQAGSLIWTRLLDDGPAGADGPARAPPLADVDDAVALYGVVIKASPAQVAAALALYRFRTSGRGRDPEMDDETCSTSSVDAYSFRSVARKQAMTTEVRLFIQPIDGESTGVHAILLGDPAAGRRLEALRHHAQRLTRLRDDCERLARIQAPPAAPAGYPS